MKYIKVFLKKKMKKNMIREDTKLYQKMKKKSWPSIKKIAKENDKKNELIIVLGNFFNLENLIFS